MNNGNFIIGSSLSSLIFRFYNLLKNFVRSNDQFGNCACNFTNESTFSILI